MRAWLASAVGHCEHDAYHDGNDNYRRADPHEEPALPGLSRLARLHLRDLRPGDFAVSARLGHLLRSSLPGQAAVQPPVCPGGTATEPIGRRDRAIPARTCSWLSGDWPGETTALIAASVAVATEAALPAALHDEHAVTAQLAPEAQA